MTKGVQIEKISVILENDTEAIFFLRENLILEFFFSK